MFLISGIPFFTSSSLKFQLSVFPSLDRQLIQRLVEIVNLPDPCQIRSHDFLFMPLFKLLELEGVVEGGISRLIFPVCVEFLAVHVSRFL